MKIPPMKNSRSNLPLSFSDFLHKTAADESQKVLDAYSSLGIGEAMLGEFRNDGLRMFTKKDGEILENAISDLRKSLTGEYNQLGDITKPRCPFEDIPAVYDAFTKAISSLSPDALRTFERRVADNKGTDESQQKRLESIKEKHQQRPAVKPKYQLKQEPEAIEENPVPQLHHTTTPSHRDDTSFRLGPVISEVINTSIGSGQTFGEKRTDKILELIEKELTKEEFDAEVQKLLPKKTEDVEKLKSNLSYLYENWKPTMDKQSNLSKTIGSYKISLLGTNEILLETSQLTASLRFASTAATCKKFIEIATEADVKSAFDVEALLAMEASAPGDDDYICPMCDTGYHERCEGKNCQCGCRNAPQTKVATKVRVVTSEELQKHLEEDVDYFKAKIEHHKKVVEDLKAQLSKAGDDAKLKELLDKQIKDNTEDIAAMEKEVAERQAVKKEADLPRKNEPGEKCLGCRKVKIVGWKGETDSFGPVSRILMCKECFDLPMYKTAAQIIHEPLQTATEGEWEVVAQADEGEDFNAIKLRVAKAPGVTYVGVPTDEGWEGSVDTVDIIVKAPSAEEAKKLVADALAGLKKEATKRKSEGPYEFEACKVFVADEQSPNYCKTCKWSKESHNKPIPKIAANLEDIIKPNQKGPSAAEKKQLVEAMSQMLTAGNVQGTEQDITMKAAEMLKAKAPQYTEENIMDVARCTYAEWKAHQPIPAEVGNEGKANVGVANMDGTGTYVEPNRGDTGVQNTAPTNTVRKEATYELSKKEQREELNRERHILEQIKKCPDCGDILQDGKCWGCALLNLDKISTLQIVAHVRHDSNGWNVWSHDYKKHLGGPYKTKEEATKRLRQVEFFKHMKGGSMDFNVGDSAVLNQQVGNLPEGTEVEVTAQCEGDVTFISGDILGMTKVAHLDKITTISDSEYPKCDCSHLASSHKSLMEGCGCKECGCNGYHATKLTKEAADEKLEKYQWDNDGLKYKLNLGDHAKIGSIEVEGMSLKGKECIIREKVICATNGDAEQFYLVEIVGHGCNFTLPEDVLSKIATPELQTWRAIAKDDMKKEAAAEGVCDACEERLANKECPECGFKCCDKCDCDVCNCKFPPTPNFVPIKKEAVLKPNFDVVQEFLNSYDHQPTVVTTSDIEAFCADPKRNYQISKKDMKEFVKYLQSAKVEVRVPKVKELPEKIEEEVPAAEELPIKKQAVKYKYISPDGKETVEKDVTEDMGAGFETDDPKTPGQKMKWVRASAESVEKEVVEVKPCEICHGQKVVPCECIEDVNFWKTMDPCKKCNDECTVPCKCAAMKKEAKKIYWCTGCGGEIKPEDMTEHKLKNQVGHNVELIDEK